jgi:hypothetical protein
LVVEEQRKPLRQQRLSYGVLRAFSMRRKKEKEDVVWNVPGQVDHADKQSKDEGAFPVLTERKKELFLSVD